MEVFEKNGKDERGQSCIKVRKYIENHPFEIVGLALMAFSTIAALGVINDMSHPVSDTVMQVIRANNPVEFTRIELHTLAQKVMASWGSPLGGVFFYLGRTLNRH